MVPSPTSQSGQARRLLRVTGALGASTVLVIVFSIVRAKVVASAFGPSGIGLIAILQGLQAPINLVLGLGIGTSGLIEIAAARGAEDADRIRTARWAMIVAAVAGGLVATGVYVLAAGLLARQFGGGEASVADFRLFGLAFGIGFLAGNLHATMNGFRRIRDLAKLDPLSAAAGTVATVLGVLTGLSLVTSVFVIPSVLTTLLTVHFARKLPALGAWPGRRAVATRVRQLARDGVPFLFASVIGAVGLLLLRLLIDGTEGRSDLGQFQAAFAVSETYVGFLLTAMTVDYLPRITEHAGDAGAVNDAANEQTRISMLLVLPLVLAMMAAAPLVIKVFYSSAFTASIELLRIQLLGEFAKVVAYSVVFILVARKARKLYIATQIQLFVSSLVATYVALRLFGIQGASVAYAISQALSLAFTLAFVRRNSGFALSRENWVMLSGGTAAALTVAFVGAPELKVVLAAIVGVGCLARLWRLTRTDDRSRDAGLAG